ncbi:hypothetical protein ACFXMT_14220 [Streptomyces mirabilis]|uniref:hypothetical protein n=1 Tax=Streptomyces mirabilis TaxID=68239 RepID=UPI0036BB9514
MPENATPEKYDVNTEAGEKAIEEINANIERIGVLIREGAEGEKLTALEEETEGIISALSGKTSIAAKTECRDKLRQTKEEAAKAAPAAEVVQVHTGTIAAKTWDQYEGTTELVNLGAEKVAEGINAHVKVSNLAKEIAAITFDLALRIPNKADRPDILLDSDPAKKGARAIYDKALPLFDDNYDNAKALKSLIRSAQDFRSDVRAEWLRSLDGDGETAAERRAIVAAVLEDKPDDEKASEWVAKAYGTTTTGQGEAKRLAYHEKKKRLEAGNTSKELESGESEETTTPDERITKLTDRLVKDITSGKPEDFENASEETKEAIREKLEKASKALKLMIAATL